MFDFKKLTLNPFKTKVGKKIGFTVGGLLVIFLVFHILDTYFNKGPAEDNLRKHLTHMYDKNPHKVICANVDTGNHDSRVSCEALLNKGDVVPVAYLCKGFLDGFSDDCILKPMGTRVK